MSNSNESRQILVIRLAYRHNFSSINNLKTIKMYVDVKVTTWQRIKIDSEATEEQVLNVLKNGSHFNLWDDEIAYDVEQLTDTEEELTPEENNGCSTIEVYNDEGALIWENATEYSEENLQYEKDVKNGLYGEEFEACS